MANLDDIEIMLRALLESQNMMQWITGVAFESNNGGPKAMLFSPVAGLQGAIVQVYKYRWLGDGPSTQLSTDWQSLPQAVRDACPPDEDLEDFGAHKQLKDWLRSKGLLFTFKPFRVVRYAKIGEDGATERWRFVGCIGSTALLDAQPIPTPQAIADGDRAALAILKEIGQLGALAYGAEPWRDGVAGDVAVWGSSGRVGSVDDLNPEEAITVRDALRRRVSKLAADVQS